MKKGNENLRLTLLLSWAMIGALSFLIMKIEVPIIPGIDYLKIDFSDAIIAISTAVFGPLGGVMIITFKSLLSLSVSGFNFISIIGQFAAFIASLVYILPYYYVSKNNDDKLKFQILGIIIGTICLTFVMTILNYYFLTPFYIKFAGFKLSGDYIKYIVSAIFPFNLIKGILNGIVIILLSKSVLPTLKKFVNNHLY